MPPALELSIDVSDAVGLGERLHTRATVVLPEPDSLCNPPVLCFGFPGGGYSRGYFTFDMPGASGAGEAGWHASRGWIFVACDHLCAGDSDTPTGAEHLKLEHFATANHAAVTHVLSLLARGSLAEGFPSVRNPVTLGIGQSMGGSFMIVQQAQHRSFDAIGVLGSSAIQTRLWTVPGAPALGIDDLRLGDLTAGFHYDDVPREVVDADMIEFPSRRGAMPAWGTGKAPACAATLLSPGVVAPEAALIDVPVLVAVGERDVVPDPHAEPRAYPRSPDVTVYVCSRMAHMHNFASTREALWNRLHHWGSAIAAMSAARHEETRKVSTYVLVHGGGHGGWCYQPVARIMRSKGHEVYTPTLTGLGEREHLRNAAIDLDMHITDVVKVLEFEDLHDVILVGHSYGGMVITGVADRASDRIGHLVFLDAANPKNGQSLVDLAAPMMVLARKDARVVDGIELVLFPGQDPMSFYGVREPEQIAWMKTKLTPHPWKCFEQKLVLEDEAAIRRIPQTHIVCTSTLATRDVPALKASSQGRVWDVDTGHDLMISEPEATAELLLRVASL